MSNTISLSRHLIIAAWMPSWSCNRDMASIFFVSRNQLATSLTFDSHELHSDMIRCRSRLPNLKYGQVRCDGHNYQSPNFTDKILEKIFEIEKNSSDTKWGIVYFLILIENCSPWPHGENRADENWGLVYFLFHTDKCSPVPPPISVPNEHVKKDGVSCDHHLA